MNKHVDPIAVFGSLKPHTFPFLRALRWDRTPVLEGGFEDRLIIELSSADQSAGRKRLELSFFGVRELEVAHLDGVLSLLIEITWIGDRQLEGLRYEVTESEWGAIALSCRDFKARVVGR